LAKKLPSFVPNTKFQHFLLNLNHKKNRHQELAKNAKNVITRPQLTGGQCNDINNSFAKTIGENISENIGDCDSKCSNPQKLRQLPFFAKNSKNHRNDVMIKTPYPGKIVNPILTN
jgi:hypothetical protein